MHKFLRNLITEWRKLELPVSGAAIVVAVSGGADSVSLALAAAELREKKKLDLRFVIAHFDHGLRGRQSEKDEEFVKKLSETLGCEFISVKWNRKISHNKTTENLEQAARLARYEFLEGAAEKFGAYGILTAHTMDDQAETFLLRLVRGSGIDGLGAMKTVRELNSGKPALLIRPLLNWARRADTEDFCRLKKTKYRDDPMNRDEAFLRVKVRRKLIPMLAKMNPAIVPNLAKMAGLLQGESKDLEAAARGILEKHTGANQESIDVKLLSDLSPAKRKRVLRLWLGGLRGGLRRLDMEHFAALERLILKGAGGKTIELPGGEAVSLNKGKLVFTQTKVEKRRTGN